MMIPEVSPAQFDKARQEALAKLFDEIEKDYGPLTQVTRGRIEAAYSAGFCDGFSFLSDHFFEWVKTIPLIPVRFEPAPPPGPLPRVG